MKTSNIYGIGIDSVQISRMEKSLASESFIARVFSAEEQEYFGAKKGTLRLQSAAACFAAKEAFLKAAGTGIGGFALAEISVAHKESGTPYFSFLGQTKTFCAQKGIAAHLSLTHEAGTATAFVILEQYDNRPKFVPL